MSAIRVCNYSKQQQHKQRREKSQSDNVIYTWRKDLPATGEPRDTSMHCSSKGWIQLVCNKEVRLSLCCKWLMALLYTLQQHSIHLQLLQLLEQARFLVTDKWASAYISVYMYVSDSLNVCLVYISKLLTCFLENFSSKVVFSNFSLKSSIYNRSTIRFYVSINNIVHTKFSDNWHHS